MAEKVSETDLTRSAPTEATQASMVPLRNLHIAASIYVFAAFLSSASAAKFPIACNSMGYLQDAGDCADGGTRPGSDLLNRKFNQLSWYGDTPSASCAAGPDLTRYIYLTKYPCDAVRLLLQDFDNVAFANLGCIHNAKRSYFTFGGASYSARKDLCTSSLPVLEKWLSHRDAVLPADLTLSGTNTSCYGGSLNGIWAYQGETKDGKYYFSRNTQRGQRYLFYDKDTDGADSTVCGYSRRWFIDANEPSTTAISDLDGDGGCGFTAYTTNAASTSTFFPPPSAAWKISCDSEWIDMAVTSFAITRQPLPPNTGMTLVADVAGTTVADDAFWAVECQKIPDNTEFLVLDMGAVRDFFKPIDSATSYCEMLQSNKLHQWSANGVDWFVVDIWDGANGGSAVFWPSNTSRVGDKRKFLSFWGHDGSTMGGCCSTSSAVTITRPSLPGNGKYTWWGQSFTMSYAIQLQPLPANTGMTLVADVAGTTLADDAFWKDKCKTIPSSTQFLVLDMGAVRLPSLDPLLCPSSFPPLLLQLLFKNVLPRLASVLCLSSLFIYLYADMFMQT